jgi:PAS domain S-box-containing protein
MQGETTDPARGPEKVPGTLLPGQADASVHQTKVRDSFSGPDEIAALRAIVEGTASATGQRFFETLVRHLAEAIDVHYAFVAEFVAANARARVRTIAYWGNGQLQENVEWQLAGTPCEEVLSGNLCHHPHGVSAKFPEDKPLADMGIESYLGVPLPAASGEVLGHLAVFDERPMPEDTRRSFIFRIFAARAAAELERLNYERRLRESEERYRDLYEEAPIGYVQEDLESRFLSANRAAMNMLGLKPEEVPGTVGMSFVANTFEAKRQVREAFAAIGRGTGTGPVILELRRKDNGYPVWVEWWSKPEPNGKYTRTMISDITARVLAEQEKARLEQQNVYLQEEIKSVHNFDEIVGQSPALMKVLDNVRRVAATDATVLITGETGTGKELIARAIHSASRRNNKPLIKINCAALPSGLVESELFGHEKGAFTGAVMRRIGRFELANGGTIFLDEIGELPAEAQAKLLRVLQDHEFERVGGGTPIKVDVRVIAATNRDLHKLAGEKVFREDLFYRLNVFPVHLAPLRERADDISLLTHFLVNKFAVRIGKRIDALSEGTMGRLLAYPWPGNVRELENIIERAVILSNSTTLEIDSETLSPTRPNSNNVQPASVQEVERNHILKLLVQTGWVIDGPRGAAKLLNLHPNTLRSRMKKLGITRPSHERS